MGSGVGGGRRGGGRGLAACAAKRAKGKTTNQYVTSTMQTTCGHNEVGTAYMREPYVRCSVVGCRCVGKVAVIKKVCRQTRQTVQRWSSFHVNEKEVVEVGGRGRCVLLLPWKRRSHVCPGKGVWLGWCGRVQCVVRSRELNEGRACEATSSTCVKFGRSRPSH